MTLPSDFLDKLMEAEGLAPIGMGEPRIAELIESVFARYEAIRGDASRLGDEHYQLQQELSRTLVPTHLLGFITTYHSHTSQIPDDVLIVHIEQAIDLVMMRHFGPRDRVFPLKLHNSYFISEDQMRLITQLPEAILTGLMNRKAVHRLADACSRNTNLTIGAIEEPGMISFIQALIMQEAILKAAKDGRGFDEMDDVSLLKFVENIQDAIHGKLQTMINTSMAPINEDENPGPSGATIH